MGRVRNASKLSDDACGRKGVFRPVAIFGGIEEVQYAGFSGYGKETRVLGTKDANQVRAECSEWLVSTRVQWP